MVELHNLNLQLRNAPSLEEKIQILNRFPRVEAWMQSDAYISRFRKVPIEWEWILKQLVAIGQFERLIANGSLELLVECLKKLAAMDRFYAELGGILGYQSKIESFLKASSEAPQALGVAYHSPFFIDIVEETPLVEEAILSGIEALAEMAEMYPLGGAADRLHLVDEETKEELPAANLCYAGRPLLAGLIRDLQAREFLYFKLFGKQLTTPVAIMTSFEKDNHSHLLKICDQLNWFGRPKDSFRLFVQPLVPAVDREGRWCIPAPCKPLLKPGGHGVLWKLARDHGIFEWFRSLKRTKALVRQINNPITSLDYGLLAFMGLGHGRKMIFGFASCPRLLQSAEGVNVVIEKQGGEIVLTNIEYCDFEKFGMKDLPLKDGEPYSRFSSNTNILFVDLQEIDQAVQLCPFPGLLINLKKARFTTEKGEKKEEVIARLESTMQNIADIFVEKKEDSFATKRTFVTYNRRHKTISTVKKAYVEGGALEETPEHCFYVQQQAARELLEDHCLVSLPSAYSLAQYLEKGPDSLFLYHPALGPLYSIIRQKIRDGSFSLHSELQLEIADMYLHHFVLDGSLLVEAEQPMGSFDPKGILSYSDRTGRCFLSRITVRNRGVDWASSRPFWRNQLHRHQALKIVLKGRSEFVAEDVTFEGNHEFIVPDGMRMRIFQKKGKLATELTFLPEGPFWIYSIHEQRVKLTAQRASCC